MPSKRERYAALLPELRELVAGQGQGADAPKPSVASGSGSSGFGRAAADAAPAPKEPDIDDLGAIPAWQAVVDRAQFLARRGQHGILYGVIGPAIQQLGPA